MIDLQKYPAIKDASFTVSDAKRIVYVKGIGFYPVFYRNFVWIAQFKDFSILETCLYSKPDRCSITSSDVFTFDESIKASFKPTQKAYQYNPTTHTEIFNSVISKDRLKKMVKEALTKPSLFNGHDI